LVSPLMPHTLSTLSSVTRLIYNINQNPVMKSINQRIKTNIEVGLLKPKSPFSPKLVREKEWSGEVSYDSATSVGERGNIDD
jgi:hypothetical protein